MGLGFEFRCRTPIVSHAARKICAMSSELFVKKYLGYAYLPFHRPAAVRVDQATKQLTRIGIYDLSLPGS